MRQRDKIMSMHMGDKWRMNKLQLQKWSLCNVCGQPVLIGKSFRAKRHMSTTTNRVCEGSKQKPRVGSFWQSKEKAHEGKLALHVAAKLPALEEKPEEQAKKKVISPGRIQEVFIRKFEEEMWEHMQQ